MATLLRSIADRIEAIDSADAWRSLYTPGNAAAMREALVAIRKALLLDSCMGPHTAFHVEVDRLTTTALSAPARQCDVGTAEEQAVRFRDMCNKYYDDENPCNKKCPMAALDIMHGWPRCQSYWAQTPYAEEGAGK